MTDRLIVLMAISRQTWMAGWKENLWG